MTRVRSARICHSSVSLACCLQLYHPDSPIHYEYGSETILLSRDGRNQTRADVEYGFLVKNEGSRSIRTLNVLYPRSLYRKVQGSWQIDGIDIVRDIVEAKRILSGLHSVGSRGGVERLSIGIPDPKDPIEDLPLPSADWTGRNDTLRCPDMDAVAVEILHFWDMTFLQMDLAVPIPPQGYRWFFFTMSHKINVHRCVAGRVMYLHVTSPIEIRNLAWELAENARKKAAAASKAVRREVLRVYQGLEKTLGLVKQYPLNVGLYELTLKPGNPLEHDVQSFCLSRDIDARSDSPRRDPKSGDLIFQFRSGRYLNERPHAGEGFHAFFRILCK